MMALSMLVMDSKTVNPRTVKTALVMSIRRLLPREKDGSIGSAAPDPVNPGNRMELLRLGFAQTYGTDLPLSTVAGLLPPTRIVHPA
jgi:hypothetical protein